MATMYSTTRPLMLTQMTTAAPTGPRQRPNIKTAQNWSRAVSARQRSLHSTLGCVPTTAGSAQFCLLCCQPEPVPESLPARPPPLTRGCPCRLPGWQGRPIHMVCGAYTTPQHSATETPIRGKEKHGPPQVAHPRCASAPAPTTHKCKRRAPTTEAKAQAGGLLGGFSPVALSTYS